MTPSVRVRPVPSSYRVSPLPNAYSLAVFAQTLLIEQAIYLILSANAGVSALVGTRVFPGFLPQTVTYPAITYRLVGRDHIKHLGGSTGLAISRVRFVMSAKGPRGPGVYADAKLLYEATRLCLEGYRGTVTSGLQFIVIQAIEADSEFDDYHDPTQTHQVIADFVVSASEQMPT